MTIKEGYLNLFTWLELHLAAYFGEKFLTGKLHYAVLFVYLSSCLGQESAK